MSVVTTVEASSTNGTNGGEKTNITNVGSEQAKEELPLVLCKDCPREAKHKVGGCVWVNDTQVSIRQGRVQGFCTVCKSKAVDLNSGFCFACERVQVINTYMLCVECKRRAPHVTALKPKPKDFYCEMEASPVCSEGDFVAQLQTCKEKHTACAECFFLFAEMQINSRELRWSYSEERYSVGCFGFTNNSAGMTVKCNALLDDEVCLTMLPEATQDKFAKFSIEKLTERLEGVICPLPRCSEALLDVPPVAKQKCVRCPYCTRFFCQKCKNEAELLGMNGDLVGGGDGNDVDDVDEDEIQAQVAQAAGGTKESGTHTKFRLLCKTCDLDWAGKDSATQDLIKSSSKPCPFCAMPTSHYRGHACHHIRGCLNCKQHWCYLCSGKSKIQNGWAAPCDCVKNGLQFCDRLGTCGCPICPDCRPGAPCPNCSGGNKCPSCDTTHPEHELAKKLWKVYYGD